MSYKITLQEFEDLNMFSNKTMEEIVRGIVNESSNAAFVSMADDSVILFDHEEGQFYLGDYNFDKENLQLKVENFDVIDLIKEGETFSESVRDFFEDDNVDTTDLLESYKTNVTDKDKFLTGIISEAVSAKNFEDKADYCEISKIIKENKDELVSTTGSLFEYYTNRISERPMSSLKLVNWKEGFKVSLLETETKKIVGSSLKKKAMGLWKDENFKESFIEATEIFLEEVEQGNEMYITLFEEYPQALTLDKTERKIMLSKIIISEAELKPSLKQINAGINILFEKYELADLKEAADGENDTEDEDDGEEEIKEPTDDETKKISSDLKKVAEKCEDETTKKSLDGLITKLDKGIKEGLKLESLREAISILSL